MSTELDRALRLDAAAETERICQWLRDELRSMRKQGLVVALSGGIDSSVVGALAVRALGGKRVCGLSLPERESSATTRELSRTIAAHLGVNAIEIDITKTLESLHCYALRDAAIARLVPGYGTGWRSKIVLASALESKGFRVFTLVASDPSGHEQRVRMDADAYLHVVAATNFKQRVRKLLEYYHADQRNYAVAGTPNRLEYDQGFFVKLGDGAADLKPIAHLYKTQVYALGAYLGLPADIQRRTPTTDTYSLSQGQDEFYFSLPYEQFDLCLWAKNHGIASGAVAVKLGLTAAQVDRVYADIDNKRIATRDLHERLRLVEPVVLEG